MSVLPLAVTMGEPAGISGEISLMAWQDLRGRDKPHSFFVIDDADRLKALARSTGIDTPVAEIATPEDANALFSKALPVLPHDVPRPVAAGSPDSANGSAVVGSIARAVELCAEGRAGGIVTGPVHKDVLMDGGFKHPGQTELLGELCTGLIETAPQPVMMLTCPGLRVVPVTVHMGLADVPAALSAGRISVVGAIVCGDLKRYFDIETPKVAVAALNPHAGENGRFGREEIDVIAPAIERLQSDGHDVHGPYPADSLFHEEARDKFDAIICMYHDQALIPLKTIDFHHGVNVTLGIPVVRTSPDHGTAFDIAGTGKANPTSMVAAIETAAAMAGNLALRRAAQTG